MESDFVLSMALDKFRNITSNPLFISFMEEFHLNSFWIDNVSYLKSVFKDSRDATDLVCRVQRTKFFSVNTDDEYKEDAVDWLLNEQKSRGVDVFAMPEVVQEAECSYAGNNVVHNGRRLTPDFLRTVTIAGRIADKIQKDVQDKLVVLELGAGMGHLARTLHLFGLTRQHIIIDLPETLVCSFCFLSLNFPDAAIKIATTEQEIDKAVRAQADFILIPNFLANALENVRIDLFVNTASLGEMKNDNIIYWMDFIQKKINPSYIFTLNRFLNTLKSNEHSFRWGENVCSVTYDDRWKIINWEVAPRYTRCPYVDTLIARYVEIIAKRQALPDSHAGETAAGYLGQVARQDWYRFRDEDSVMTMRDGALTPDLSMEGTLFRLWEAMRLSPSARAAGMMARYLYTLHGDGSREFEEEAYYREQFFALSDGSEAPSDIEHIQRQHDAKGAAVLIGQRGSFNIVAWGNRFLALSLRLGEVRVGQDIAGTRDLGDVVLVAEDLAGLHAKIDILG